MKNKRWLPKILVVGSGMWACLAFVPGLKEFLDLELPLPVPVKWGIFSILLVAGLAWEFYKKKDESPVEPGPDLLEYLNHGMISQNKEINVEAAKISISARESGKNTVTEIPKFLQKVVWELQCVNAANKAKNYYEFVISLSLYSGWNDGSVGLSATLEVGSSEYCLDNFHIKEIPNAPDLRIVRFLFPNGVKVNRCGHFTIRVILEWKQARVFKKDERIFFDPGNYGQIVDDIKFEAELASSFFLDRKLVLYVVDKTTRTMTKEHTKPKHHENKTMWVVTPAENILYCFRCIKQGTHT